MYTSPQRILFRTVLLKSHGFWAAYDSDPLIRIFPDKIGNSPRSSCTIEDCLKELIWSSKWFWICIDIAYVIYNNFIYLDRYIHSYLSSPNWAYKRTELSTSNIQVYLLKRLFTSIFFPRCIDIIYFHSIIYSRNMDEKFTYYNTTQILKLLRFESGIKNELRRLISISVSFFSFFNKNSSIRLSETNASAPKDSANG